MEHIFVVDNVDELQGIMPGSAEYVQLAGHTRPGDGGEGLCSAGPREQPLPITVR